MFGIMFYIKLCLAVNSLHTNHMVSIKVVCIVWKSVGMQGSVSQRFSKFISKFYEIISCLSFKQKNHQHKLFHKLRQHCCRIMCNRLGWSDMKYQIYIKHCKIFFILAWELNGGFFVKQVPIANQD